MSKYNFRASQFQTYAVENSTIDTDSSKPIYIFWTGGWDSSFRILQLSSKDVVIQPIYLDGNRTSANNELSAIDIIGNLIGKLKTTRCTILDLMIINTDEVDSDAVITKAYKALLEKKFMGSQYDWLARFAKEYNEIELCIHKDDKAHEVIETFGADKKITDEYKGDYYIVDRSESSNDLVDVFGNYHFPLLQMTKLEMKKEAELNGFIDILNQSWFCFSPINGKPCGLCNPCVYSIEEGMKHRFSKAALLRYKTRGLRKLISITLEKLYLLDFAKKIRDKLFR